MNVKILSWLFLDFHLSSYLFLIRQWILNIFWNNLMFYHWTHVRSYIQSVRFRCTSFWITVTSNYLEVWFTWMEKVKIKRQDTYSDAFFPYIKQSKTCSFITLIVWFLVILIFIECSFRHKKIFLWLFLTWFLVVGMAQFHSYWNILEVLFVRWKSYDNKKQWILGKNE